MVGPCGNQGCTARMRIVLMDFGTGVDGQSFQQTLKVTICPQLLFPVGSLDPGGNSDNEYSDDDGGPGSETNGSVTEDYTDLATDLATDPDTGHPGDTREIHVMKQQMEGTSCLILWRGFPDMLYIEGMCLTNQEKTTVSNISLYTCNDADQTRIELLPDWPPFLVEKCDASFGIFPVDCKNSQTKLSNRTRTFSHLSL